ncbi:efflux RND transporter periplasmic adaptor subunit [Thiocystis violacea]|uniref:efflux RND transporter periplasmic adaptor subunit n=1 Tax=Thiocystis violacea TaxID=13725 RepID=UPI00190378BE|nr:efflux RND transporter periplasmic adaptor subunit [Thiocystis violacea]MBK1719849.1 efflux transporter periplasmic adaptor subunit [Thiocystis violacea]
MNRRRPPILRHAGSILIVLAALALILWGFRPVPRLVDVEPVTRGHLAVTLEAEARTRVIDRYRISAPIAGRVGRLNLEVGDPVAAGEVVAVMEAAASPALDRRHRQQARARIAAAEAELAAARAAVEAAEANEALARAELARMEPLAGRGMVSLTQLDQARAEARGRAAELVSARFGVDRAEHDLTAAQADLAYTGELEPGEQGRLALRAPVAGRILKREFESARVVQAGDPILEIGDPERLEIEADVLSADAVRLAPGMPVWLERWGDPEPLEARVERVEPVAFTKISALGVEEQRVWVIASLVSPRAAWRRLGDAYRLNARFVLWEAEDVLQVPSSGLFRWGEAWALFLVDDGRARSREVEVGRRGALRTELRRGLEPGDQVIVHPDREVIDGARVKVRGTSPDG